MLDPIGGFNRIKEFFISYVDTSFRISEEEASKARYTLLQTTGVLATEPFIEPVLKYQPSNEPLEMLALSGKGPLESLSQEGRYAFAELALSGLFDGESCEGPIRRKSIRDRHPYSHQVEMLARGLQPGKPGIVTSGTGSGKTESFMLPVLAAIANEAVTWAQPEPYYLKNCWWDKEAGEWEARRTGEKRPAAVRALVLYPMNALVEDQMVRLRKTLDSVDAHTVMDERFSGNRIFFGQYTSATPVTGYEHHPRLADKPEEKERRKSRIQKLRFTMRDLKERQDNARRHDLTLSPKEDKTRYIFPSVNGGEMNSRWDMHAAPPDVLVTNASMLGAMLSREVEDPIFDKTREWLQAQEDAYFYLIFDELHLIRGSAGTEVAFLIKSLIERLGLNLPEHRHKLRILASSASLPMDGDAGIQSRTYLRDLFAPFGSGRRGNDDLNFWADCVVKGYPHIPQWSRGPVDAMPFIHLMQAAVRRNDFVADLERTSQLISAIREAACALGATGDTDDALVSNLAERAAELLTHACREGDGVRAISADEIAMQAFLPGAVDPQQALRGLMLARALPESGLWQAQTASTTPSFRVHTFIRNIEGLFASPSPDGKGVSYSDFTIERGVSHAAPKGGEAIGNRLFELLYCEACGDLLLGGRRGEKSTDKPATELLPASGDLESLPEKASGEYYDSMLLDEFAIFWPRSLPPQTDEEKLDSWVPAYLDPRTGIVRLGASVPEDTIGGHIYHQKPQKKTKKSPDVKPPSAQPFCCPKCGTDYSNRPSSSRLRSPIRAFRTGVTKSSQLVATELFELLHAIKGDKPTPKGIVFSDSRQDAANQALEIENLHLRDLRREVLVTVARDYVEKAANDWLSEEGLEKLVANAKAQGNTKEVKELYVRFGSQDDTAPGRKVQLDRLLQCGADNTYIGAFVAELIRHGICPADETELKKEFKRPWQELFQKKGDAFVFAAWLSESDLLKLKQIILDAQYELVDDLIFSRSFFALEETGLAYPSTSIEESEKIDEMDAWLRIFAGAYRVEDNRFANPNMKEWWSYQDVSHERTKGLAKKILGEQNCNVRLTDVLRGFSDKHPALKIKIGNLYLKVAKAEDPYWRCHNCERVHMHRGVKRCTRCGEVLPEAVQGQVSELWSRNFLSRRIVRGHDDGVARFRLRVEELTGQTEDFAERLRKFKGVFIGDISEIQKLAAEIDMLSVTTTMEVGIDIGALQSVYQGNMPPQRFNYQQRVGRAGRRGQAFSFVVTFCRGRSHDAYYYAHPKAITGDAPPPPFLAVGHDPIPLRLLRKAWLRAAFKALRDECKEKKQDFPGDFLSPPDVHGEYVTTYDYYYDKKENWPGRLRAALDKTIRHRDSFVETACFDEKQRARLLAEATIDRLLEEIEDHRPEESHDVGLARHLAEEGLLPMYGMPTRVKDLYLGLRKPNADYNDSEWMTIDRDMDLAVFEFAPGAVLVKDKMKHRVIGFTGVLADKSKRGDSNIKALSHWKESERYLALCPSCGAAKHENKRLDGPMECDDCGNTISAADFKLFVTPTAFRTDFEPQKEKEGIGRMATQTVVTMEKEGALHRCGPIGIRSGADVTVIQLNHGASGHAGDGLLFSVSEVYDNRVPSPRGVPFRINNMAQAIDISCVQFKDPRWQALPESEGVEAQKFGLIARKKTEALTLELQSFDPRLTLDMVARKGEHSDLGARAAAISATQILVQKAALLLDVSPDEFEALEPRRKGKAPMLQIADALINGSGLCRRLSEPVSEERPPQIAELIGDILAMREEWPLGDFLGIDQDGDHAERCWTSCYRCIQRYGNRRYHGLLDWRLGLSYLRAMTTPGYACGLALGDEAYPEIKGWNQRARALAEVVARMRSGVMSNVRLPHSGLPCLIQKNDGRTLTRTVVIHPLWKSDEASLQALLGSDWSSGIRAISTFDLERRPLRKLAILDGQSS